MRSGAGWAGGRGCVQGECRAAVARAVAEQACKPLDPEQPAVAATTSWTCCAGLHGHPAQLLDLQHELGRLRPATAHRAPSAYPCPQPATAHALHRPAPQCRLHLERRHARAGPVPHGCRRLPTHAQGPAAAAMVPRHRQPAALRPLRVSERARPGAGRPLLHCQAMLHCWVRCCRRLLCWHLLVSLPPACSETSQRMFGRTGSLCGEGETRGQWAAAACRMALHCLACSCPASILSSLPSHLSLSSGSRAVSCCPAPPRLACAQPGRRLGLCIADPTMPAALPCNLPAHPSLPAPPPALRSPPAAPCQGSGFQGFSFSSGIDCGSAFPTAAACCACCRLAGHPRWYLARTAWAAAARPRTPSGARVLVTCVVACPAAHPLAGEPGVRGKGHSMPKDGGGDACEVAG